MIRRVLIVLCLGIAAASLLAPALAADEDELPVVVLDVRKPADQRLLDWIAETLETTDAYLFVLQVDSPGISSGDPARLFTAIGDPSRVAPVVVWVGPNPAVAYGGMACLLSIADRVSAAPGTRIGHLAPAVVTDPAVTCPGAETGLLAALSEATITVGDPAPGLVDDVAPSIGQLIVGLDGVVITMPGGATVTLATAATETLEDGTEVPVVSRPVEFRKPGLFDRFLRLASRPEAAFFFLVAAVAMATFEFYAAGVGVTAAVAALSLVLAGYGLATLPIDITAVVAALAGLFLYTWDFQRVAIGWRSLLGTALLIWGGLTFTNAAPQFGPVWWIVLTVVIGAALFYGIALTTIARSRFSTRTIGRGHLVGKVGTAETDLSPDGVVEVEGARWRGRSHREAGIRAGDRVTVSAVAGIVLEVEPTSESAVRD
jgi:membrane-bound ClpP family serine protease